MGWESYKIIKCVCVREKERRRGSKGRGIVSTRNLIELLHFMKLITYIVNDKSEVSVFHSNMIVKLFTDQNRRKTKKTKQWKNCGGNHPIRELKRILQIKTIKTMKTDMRSINHLSPLHDIGLISVTGSTSNAWVEVLQLLSFRTEIFHLLGIKMNF